MAKRMSRGDKILAEKTKAQLRQELGLEFHGQAEPVTGPPHLWPNLIANDPLFRKFKGDSKVSQMSEARRDKMRNSKAKKRFSEVRMTKGSKKKAR